MGLTFCTNKKEIKIIKDTIPFNSTDIRELEKLESLSLHKFLHTDNKNSQNNPYSTRPPWKQNPWNKELNLFRISCSEKFAPMRYNQSIEGNYIDEFAVEKAKKEQLKMLFIQLKTFTKEEILLGIYIKIMPNFSSKICNNILKNYNGNSHKEIIALLYNAIKNIEKEFENVTKKTQLIINNIFLKEEIPQKLTNKILEYLSIQDLYKVYPSLKKIDPNLYNTYITEAIQRNNIQYLIFSTHIGEEEPNETNSKTIQELEGIVESSVKSSEPEIKKQLNNVTTVYINLSV